MSPEEIAALRAQVRALTRTIVREQATMDALMDPGAFDLDAKPVAPEVWRGYDAAEERQSVARRERAEILRRLYA